MAMLVILLTHTGSALARPVIQSAKVIQARDLAQVTDVANLFEPSIKSIETVLSVVSAVLITSTYSILAQLPTQRVSGVYIHEITQGLLLGR
jgi:hypothetical protein